MLLLAGSVSSAMASNRIALVIGNADYKTEPLANPMNDARAMANKLKLLGFTVTKLENATRSQMANAIAAFEGSLTNEDVSLFYYAGHGIQVRGRNYLLPVNLDADSEAGARANAVPVGLVAEAMEYAGSKVNFIILDACRNNPFERKLRGGSSRGLAPVDAASGTLVAYATAPGSVAEDGVGSNGVYTKALLAALSEPGLKAEEVFKKVRADVYGSTNGRQTPWESSSLTGDFIFNGIAVVNVNPATTTPAIKTARADREALFWESVKDTDDAALYQAYLDRYPGGDFEVIARIKLERLRDQEATQQLEQEGTPKVAAIAPQ